MTRGEGSINPNILRTSYMEASSRKRGACEGRVKKLRWWWCWWAPLFFLSQEDLETTRVHLLPSLRNLVEIAHSQRKQGSILSAENYCLNIGSSHLVRRFHQNLELGFRCGQTLDLLDILTEYSLLAFWTRGVQENQCVLFGTNGGSFSWRVRGWL